MHKRIINKIKMQNRDVWYIRYETIALELKKNEKSVYLHSSTSLSNQKSQKFDKPKKQDFRRIKIYLLSCLGN